MMKIIQSIFLFLFLSFSAAVFAEPVNINKADAAELAASLVGVGEARAKAIVEYREANGPFKSAEDLKNVKGIGDGVLAKNAEKIVTK